MNTTATVKRYPTRLHVRCGKCLHQGYVTAFLDQVKRLRCTKCGSRAADAGSNASWVVAARSGAMIRRRGEGAPAEGAMKKPDLIKAADVRGRFRNTRVWWMARQTNYDPGKQPGFAEVVREAVLELLDNIGRPTSNQVHQEIAELVRVAARATRARKRPDHWCEQAACLVERLSPPAKKIMDRRGTLPDAAMLRDPATQLDACHVSLGLGRLGVSHEGGRIRERDEQGRVIKRSVSEVSQLYAPKLQERPLRHEPHTVFLARLENAHLRATGELPPFTTNHARPNDFTKFAQACLDEAGTGASAIELLEARHRRRQVKELHHVAGRWDKAIDDQILRWARRRILDVVKRLSLSNP
jgi:hypothetical protein